MWLRDTNRLVRRDWPIAVACLIIGVALAVLATMYATPKYSATTEYYVSVRTSDSAARDRAAAADYVYGAVQSFAAVIPTSLVLDPVIDELGLDTDVKELAKQIGVGVDPSSAVMSITVIDPMPEQAARIANAVGRSFASAVATELEAVVEGQPGRIGVETVEQATVPTRPTSPSWPVNIALGVMLGIGLAVVIVVLRVRFDTRLRSLDDIESAAGVPVFGAIPADPAAASRPLIAEEDATGSLRDEAFRALRTNVSQLSAGSPMVLVIAGTRRGEGTATTAANLAIALAGNGSSVALVEGDLRRPRMAGLFGIEEAPGLSEVLVGTVPVSSAVQRCGSGRLFVLPAGMVPPSPAELLASPATQRVVAELGEAFDVVVIAAPPLLAVSDALILARSARGVLVTVASGATRRPELQSVVRQLEFAGIPLLGLVATMLPPQRLRPRVASPAAAGGDTGGFVRQ